MEIALSRTDPIRLLLKPDRSVVHGEVVTLSYTDPTAADDVLAIQDRSGNDADSFIDVRVTNDTVSLQRESCVLDPP